MTTTYGFKPIHDLPEFYPCANTLVISNSGADWSSDYRNSTDRNPFLWNNNFNGNLVAYNPITDGHIPMATIAGTQAGSGSLFVPSAGPNGTITTGATTTSVVLSTALPAAVGINQLANRGDGIGYKIRIIGNSSGGSGKTEEQLIIGNTAGTTPTITLAGALSFTPASGDRYEILSGRVFIISSGPTWKYYDVATGFLSSSLTVTNLTFNSGGSSLIVFDELYVPLGQTPGQGFFGNLTATATSSTTITGTSSAADASLQSSEYANFQVRIVTDTGTPTSVGQRRKISSHTAANPTVYTISSAWTVTPSSTATYVIEGVGDLAYSVGGSAVVCTYAAGGFRADGAWSTGATNGTVAAMQIPNKPASSGTGSGLAWAFGMSSLDTAKNARYSMVYCMRGGNTATIDVLDIATLSWSTGAGGTDIAYGGKGLVLPSTGSSPPLNDPIGNSGNYFYINPNAGSYFYRFDMKNRNMIAWNYLRQPQSTGNTCQRAAMAYAQDGSAYGPYLYINGSNQTSFFRCLIPN